MSELVGATKPVGIDVGVALRGVERRMAEHLLHGAEIGSALQEVGRGGVAQGVRRDIGNAGERGERVNVSAHLTLVDPAAAASHEEWRGRAARRPRGRCPATRSSARIAGTPNGTTRSLSPLPTTRTVSSARSRSATSTPVSSPTRIPVAYSSSAMAQSRRSRGSPLSARTWATSRSRLTSSTLKDFGKGARGPRGGQPQSGVVIHDAGAVRPREEGADSRAAPRQGAPALAVLGHVCEPGADVGELHVAPRRIVVQFEVGGEVVEVAEIGPDRVGGGAVAMHERSGVPLPHRAHLGCHGPTLAPSLPSNQPRVSHLSHQSPYFVTFCTVICPFAAALRRLRPAPTRTVPLRQTCQLERAEGRPRRRRATARQRPRRTPRVARPSASARRTPCAPLASRTRGALWRRRERLRATRWSAARLVGQRCRQLEHIVGARDQAPPPRPAPTHDTRRTTRT